MNRNSTDIWIPSPNAITRVPWVNDEPDFDGFEEPTLSILQAAYAANIDNIVVIPDPIPEPPIVLPDWDGLNQAVLGGVLFPLYEKLNTACLNAANPSLAEVADAQNVSVATDRIIAAVQVTRIEAALAASLSMLFYSSFEFTQEEKDLWNSTVASLGFSEIVYQ